MEKIQFKRSLKLAHFYLGRWGRMALARLQLFLTNLYKVLKFNKVVYFACFLGHRYSVNQFDVQCVQENLRILIRLSEEEFLDASKKGELKLIGGRGRKGAFFCKNLLLFGAYQSRVERVVFYTLLSNALELNNPFDKEILRVFLPKKITLLEKVLDKLKTINGKRWNRDAIFLHIDLFYRNSLLQREIVRTMKQVLHRQKEFPFIRAAKESIQRGLFPILVTSGCSGSYWMRGKDREVVGIFKPFDEEIHAPNNPIGPSFQGSLGRRKTRYGCRVGEAAHHEVGAYLVDAFFGFGIVPKTYYASFTYHGFFLTREDRLQTSRSQKTKAGSFQEYVEGFTSLQKLPLGEWGSISFEEYQLLVVLDLILGNTDRNTGNLLVSEGKIAAVDHGLCFPDWVGDKLSYWYWSYFDYGKQPIYPTLVELLKQFPFETLGWKLRKNCCISLASIDRMRERITLFTEGAIAGLSPQKLEGLMQPEYLSPLVDHKTTLREVAAQQVRNWYYL